MTPPQVFLTSRYLGIVMEYVTGGDLADMVDVWNVRNRKSHRARGPGEPIPHQCASRPLLMAMQAPTRCITSSGRFEGVMSRKNCRLDLLSGDVFGSQASHPATAHMSVFSASVGTDSMAL